MISVYNTIILSYPNCRLGLKVITKFFNDLKIYLMELLPDLWNRFSQALRSYIGRIQAVSRFSKKCIGLEQGRIQKSVFLGWNSGYGRGILLTKEYRYVFLFYQLFSFSFIFFPIFTFFNFLLESLEGGKLPLCPSPPPPESPPPGLEKTW